jgi:hypothetical protein
VPGDTLRALLDRDGSGVSLSLRAGSLRRLSADRAEGIVQGRARTAAGAGGSGPAHALVFTFRRDPAGWVIDGVRPLDAGLP